LIKEELIDLQSSLFRPFVEFGAEKWRADRTDLSINYLSTQK